MRNELGAAAATPVGALDPGERRRILVVDDEEDSRRMLGRVLTALGYDVELARDGVEALAKLQLDIDLVTLDAEMPNLDGFGVARRIRERRGHAELPIIMVTALGGQTDRLRAVEVGINDFIEKPYAIDEIRLRVGWLLRLKMANDELQASRAELERMVERRTASLRDALQEMAAAQRETYAAQLDTIHRLVLAAEFKDRDTAAHIERIGLYCELVAREMHLAPAAVEVVRYASQMHDVGKIGIPDAILLKPESLDDHEWAIMKEHTVIGSRILQGSPSKVLQAGEMIALSHHEKWDGTGYPRGLRGEDIPLYGRICTVADVFDALTSNRHYRDALSTDSVLEMMRAQRGKHFDPDILDVFLHHRADVMAIQRQSLREK